MRAAPANERDAGILATVLAYDERGQGTGEGKGRGLDDPVLGNLTPPVTAQLINQPSNVCFEGVFDTQDVIKNEATQFKAKAQ